MARYSLIALLAIFTLCLTSADGIAAAKRSSLRPLDGTVQGMLNRLRAKGVCLVRRLPGEGANLCHAVITKLAYIELHPDRLDAKLDAIDVSLIIENTDSRMPRGEAEKSTRVALRVIHELFPHWVAGDHWLRSALKKARASECIIVTHVDGYAISITGRPAMDYNLTTADLVIAPNEVAAKYQENIC
jgi:hypothetical protein